MIVKGNRLSLVRANLDLELAKPPLEQSEIDALTKRFLELGYDSEQDLIDQLFELPTGELVKLVIYLSRK